MESIEEARGLDFDASQFSNVTEFNACLKVIYESLDRIFLRGYFITPAGEDNYGVENVLITGQGGKANPHSYVVTMTK